MEYLRVGGLAGSIIFAFGLMAVVFFDLKLFTGKSQFVWGKAKAAGNNNLSHAQLAAILALNIAGCAIMTLLDDPSARTLQPSGIVEARLHWGAAMCGLRAIPCGFIMTLSVRAAKAGLWWPLLFGVPVFIICGFPHCVADVYYYAASPQILAARPMRVLTVYAACVIGNYLGCNIYRSFTPLTDKKL